MDTQWPSAQDFLLPNLYFMLTCLSNTISELFPLQVAHHAGHAVLRRCRQQHVGVVGHQVPLDDLYPLVLAELPEDLPKVGPYLVVDDFAPILRREHDVALAHPLRVRQAVGLLGHTPPPPSPLGFPAA